DFEYVVISDTVSDMRHGWGDTANKLFNKELPALFKTDVHQFHIDSNVKDQIERQAPIVLQRWLKATCPSWKPFNTT
ncbi:hypothetical protein PFISCL1PPCAC_7493, partial [Pristionchus fissidentatus]